MSYTIKQFTPNMVDKYFDSYIATIHNLTDSGKQSPSLMKQSLQAIHEQWSIVFVACDIISDEIVWSVSLLVEQKLIRWCSKAWHIEDVATRAWHEGKGIWSSLIHEAIKHAKQAWCYKIILDCDTKLSWYYARFGFEEKWVEMKMYLEKL